MYIIKRQKVKYADTNSNNAVSRVELLAPAKNLEQGREAINHGADAVYIGAPAFGARVAAGNSISEIEQLARYAHRYHAKVFATDEHVGAVH